MSLTPYVDWALRSAPPWLSRRFGRTWTEALALTWDIATDAARHAVLARFVDRAPSDALPYIASERQLEPMPGELEATWRERLRTAWEAWPWAGTAKGVVDNIKLTGLSNVSLYTYWDWPLGDPTRWARYWVVVAQPHPWSAEGAWQDAGTWADAGTWGSTATEDEAARVVRQVRLWAPAHARCEAIYLALSGGLWLEPDGTWEGAGEWNAGVIEWRP